MAKEQTWNGPQTAESILLRDAEITGDIVIQGDLAIWGKVNGNIDSQGKVTVCKDAVVNGNITGKTADIDGYVSGNIRTGSFTVRENARIDGVVESSGLRVYGDKINIASFRFVQK